jgi:capsular exopolysaccharide synthesis family protein
VLRTNLQYVKVDQPPRAVTVTSSVAAEGKSFTACNLALALADAGKRVILVDADLRRPQACAHLGLPASRGLTTVLAGEASLEEVMVATKNRMLSAIPSGPIPPNPSELLGTARMIALLEQLKELADMVVIDSPPLLPVADAAILAHISDGTILVALHGKVRRDQVSRSVEQLDAVGARLLGSVLNRAPGRGIGPYGYYGAGLSPVPNLTGVVGATITPLQPPTDVGLPAHVTTDQGAPAAGAAMSGGGLPGSRSQRI